MLTPNISQTSYIFEIAQYNLFANDVLWHPDNMLV